MRHHLARVAVSRGVLDVEEQARRKTKGPLGRRFRTSFVKVCACILIGLATTATPAHAKLGDDPALDGAFESLAKLEIGQDLGVFNPIELAILKSAVDESVRTDLESRLLATLQSSTTDLAKQYVCRQLAMVGSDTAVPALASLLPNPSLSHMARTAIEGINTPLAIEALRASLGKTTGAQRVGIVISLGRLVDAGSVPAIAVLLDEDDELLCQASIVALGRIGTVVAARALSDFAGKVPKDLPRELRNSLVDARLHTAELLCQAGELQVAAEVCQSLQSDESDRVKTAAYRTLIAAKPAAALTMIVAGLGAEQPWKLAVAADCVVGLDEPEQILAIVSALPDLPASGQVAALVSLRRRVDPAVREAALKLLDHSNRDVRVAALEALIASGTAEDVPRLVQLASTSNDLGVGDVAFNTLRLMPAAGTNQAIASLMTQSQSPDPTVVRVASLRRSRDFVPAFFQTAESGNIQTRIEAFKALEIMAAQQDAETLVRLLCKTQPGAEREAAGRAVWMSCQKIPDPATRSAPLLAAMAQASAAGRCAILPSLARMGGGKSLAAVHVAMQSSDSTVRDAGYRALANWPDATVADELLKIAKTSEMKSYRTWSLRAYARVVALPNKRSAQETFEMLKAAMELAERTEDKELIIARLGSVRAPDALTLLLSFVEMPELKDAAVPAIFTLAKGLSQSHAEQAEMALERIRPLITDPEFLQKVPKVLSDIKAREQLKKK